MFVAVGVGVGGRIGSVGSVSGYSYRVKPGPDLPCSNGSDSLASTSSTWNVTVWPT